MKRTLLFLAMLVTTLVYGQDYSNVCTPGVTTYRSSQAFNNLKAFRYDSLRLPGNGDSVFISFPCLKYIASQNIMDTAAGGILGHRIVKRHDGWLLFFNVKGDTIRINAQAALNESWTMTVLPGGGRLTARVDTIVADSILGTADSVKVIHLQAYDSLGNPVAHSFNGLPFRLARSFGLATLYDLWAFPNDTAAWNLAGMTHGKKGLQPLRMRDVYDFDTGDEFHSRRHIEYSTYNSAYTDNKSIRYILERNYAPDSSSATYRIAQCFSSESHFFHPPDTTYSESLDTITESYDFATLEGSYCFNRLPGEFYCTHTAGGLRYANDYYRSISDCGGKDRRSNEVRVDYYVCGQQTGYKWIAYAAMVQMNKYLIRKFTEGFGQTGVLNSMESYKDDSLLVFAAKGTSVCGTRLAADCSALLGTGPVLSHEAVVLRVIPNPVETLARIVPEGLPAPVTVTLVVRDALGRTVYRKTFRSDEILFDLNGLGEGIYFLTLTDESGRLLGSVKVIVAGR